MPLTRFNNSLIGTDSIISSKLVDGSITTSKIANDAVTTDKIANTTVTSAKIANDAVTTDKILDGTITVDKLTTTLDLSSKTITLPVGVGYIDWTKSTETIQTADFTASAGTGYYLNTTSNVITVTLPANPELGDFVALVDVTGNFLTNRVTIDPNSNNINSSTFNLDVASNRAGIMLVYSGITNGWVAINSANETTTKVLN
jgi:hypothetical protein